MIPLSMKMIDKFPQHMVHTLIYKSDFANYLAPSSAVLIGYEGLRKALEEFKSVRTRAHSGRSCLSRFIRVKALPQYLNIFVRVLS